MVQGGYVSSSNAKTLTVSKKSNVLDKIPPRGPKGATQNSNASNNNNNNTSSASVVTSSIDVSSAVIFFYLTFNQIAINECLVFT